LVVSAYRQHRRIKKPFRYFKPSPEVIRLTVVPYIRYPLSLARGISYGAPSIAKAKSSKISPQYGEIARPRYRFSSGR
jgi:hypothetical protein